MFKAAFSAVGCKLNQYEVQAMAEALEPHGIAVVPFEQVADVYVINTCTVTGKADLSSRQLIRQAIRRAPEAKIIVTGCYAEIDKPSIEQIGIISFIGGNKSKKDVPRIILELLGIDSQPDSMAEMSISRMNGHSRAFVKVQDGCAEKCTYCVIWKARGRPVSRDPYQIIAEINKLHENGYNEIVLTGVHIGKYRNKADLSELLKTILSETDISQIRLSSLKPNEFTEKLLELAASEKRICPHFHIPLQSGDDSVLERMGRKYSAESGHKLVNRLVQIRPEATIGADFIVGFPGETQRNFANTLAMVKDNPIHHLHVFSYSDRPGTPALTFPDKVSPQYKAARRKALQKLGDIKKQNHLRRFIGQTLDTIIEDTSESGHSTGLTANFLKIKIMGESRPARQLVRVHIQSADAESLYGVMA
jgi:threonylcarbamoyladenosine tRNA methylthiotransferase MtaB